MEQRMITQQEKTAKEMRAEQYSSVSHEDSFPNKNR